MKRLGKSQTLVYKTLNTRFVVTIMLTDDALNCDFEYQGFTGIQIANVKTLRLFGLKIINLEWFGLLKQEWLEWFKLKFKLIHLDFGSNQLIRLVHLNQTISALICLLQ